MADIISNMTVLRWLHGKVDTIIDLTDDTIYATLVSRGINDDDALLCDVTEKQRELCLADIYFTAAISSTKTGTQGESDGGWTHYVAIKNIANRDAIMQMAKDLYDKYGESFTDPTKPKMRMQKLY